MAEYTDITVLLDRSGSMESIQQAMESAYGEFVLQHRAVPSSRLTLIQFDTENPQEVVCEATPIGQVPRLTIVPRGGTPLLDAFVRAIDRTGERLKAMGDRPDQVLFVIITDGQENSSREFKRQDVFDRVTRQRDIYKWQFVYLGANQDAIGEAASFGIPATMAMNYAPTALGTTSGTRSLSHNTVSYANRSSAAVEDFSDDQRLEAMDKKKKKLQPSTS